VCVPAILKKSNGMLRRQAWRVMQHSLADSR
jgi:hypothetical protein